VFWSTIKTNLLSIENYAAKTGERDCALWSKFTTLFTSLLLSGTYVEKLRAYHHVFIHTRKPQVSVPVSLQNFRNCVEAYTSLHSGFTASSMMTPQMYVTLAIRYLSLSISTLNQFSQKLADTALEAASLPGVTLSSVHDALVACAAEESTLDILLSKEPTRSCAFASAVSYDTDDLLPVEKF
jgi:hypothetical protein